MSLQPIARIAAALGLKENDFEPFGWYRAKVARDLEERLPTPSRGRYVAVTALTPTPPGEGKTVVTIGLAMGLSRLGYLTIPTLRQPSLAPVFGLKGGGTGGGNSQILPAEEINLHFTGDLHAIAAANNLLAALIDNHVKRDKSPPIDPASLRWRRAIDMSDKALGHIEAGLEGGLAGPRRETGFDLTAASEVMAIVALADSLGDLRKRLGEILVGLTPSGEGITAEALGAAGAMAALLRDAIRPNLVQTIEGTPAFVHAGPFANIAHGNCSILSDRIALRLADFVVTESGFGSECGFEKLIDIKIPAGGPLPQVVVVVASVRALKWHSGRFGTKPSTRPPPDLEKEDVSAVRDGARNLEGHLELIARSGLPALVALNRFPSDTDSELRAAADAALRGGARGVEVVEAFSAGGAGCEALARAVVSACAGPAPQLRPFYPSGMTPREKLRTLVRDVYGGEGVDLSPQAEQDLDLAARLGYGHFPLCVAKTQYSLSHDPTLLGRPRGFRVPVKSVRLSAGARLLLALTGDMVTLPGLPAHPAALRIDIGPKGEVTGLR